MFPKQGNSKHKSSTLNMVCKISSFKYSPPPPPPGQGVSDMAVPLIPTVYTLHLNYCRFSMWIKGQETYNIIKHEEKCYLSCITIKCSVSPWSSLTAFKNSSRSLDFSESAAAVLTSSSSLSSWSGGRWANRPDKESHALWTIGKVYHWSTEVCITV